MEARWALDGATLSIPVEVIVRQGLSWPSVLDIFHIFQKIRRKRNKGRVIRQPARQYLE